MFRPMLVAVALVGSLTVAGCSGNAGDLQKNPWQWVASVTTTPASQTVVPDPLLYSLTFGSDGKVRIKADCNTITGTYTTSGSSLSIDTSGPSTLVACPPGSLDTVFLRELSLVTSFQTGNEPDLKLTWARQEGSMQFRAAR